MTPTRRLPLLLFAVSPGSPAPAALKLRGEVGLILNPFRAEYVPAAIGA